MPLISTSSVTFKGLQDALKQAQTSLDQVYQIASALEARSTGKERPMDASNTMRNGSAPTPDTAPTPTTAPTTASSPNMTQQESFEQSIAEMRRIAGFK